MSAGATDRPASGAVASMTGFGRWEGEAGDVRLLWELRSVNGKGLDVKLRLPPGLDAIEAEARRIVAARFSRGNVQASLQLSRAAPAAELSVNRALLAEFVAVSNELVSAGHAAPPRADGLLALRGVIETREAPLAPSNHAREAALAGLEIAISELASARSDEGRALATVLLQRLAEIERLVALAAADPARTPERIAARLSSQIRALTGDAAPADPARLAQEVALLATRADIEEELDRLHAHIASARDLLSKGGPIGRRLDFLAQEFNRESNTICSKSNAASLTAIGVDLKVAVDQFREQVQNLE